MNENETADEDSQALTAAEIEVETEEVVTEFDEYVEVVQNHFELADLDTKYDFAIVLAAVAIAAQTGGIEKLAGVCDQFVREWKEDSPIETE